MVQNFSIEIYESSNTFSTHLDHLDFDKFGLTVFYVKTFNKFLKQNTTKRVISKLKLLIVLNLSKAFNSEANPKI